MLWNCIPLAANACKDTVLALMVAMTLVRLLHFIYPASFVIPKGIYKVLLQGKKNEGGN